MHVLYSYTERSRAGAGAQLVLIPYHLPKTTLVPWLGFHPRFGKLYTAPDIDALVKYLHPRGKTMCGLQVPRPRELLPPYPDGLLGLKGPFI